MEYGRRDQHSGNEHTAFLAAGLGTDSAGQTWDQYWTFFSTYTDQHWCRVCNTWRKCTRFLKPGNQPTSQLQSFQHGIKSSNSFGKSFLKGNAVALVVNRPYAAFHIRALCYNRKINFCHCLRSKVIITFQLYFLLKNAHTSQLESHTKNHP